MSFSLDEFKSFVPEAAAMTTHRVSGILFPHDRPAPPIFIQLKDASARL